MFKDKKILNEVFVDNESGDKYLVYEHGDKTWIWPADKLKEGLEMYQPTSKQGKFLKQSLPLVKGNAKALSKLGVYIIKCSIDEQLMDYIREAASITDKKVYVAGYIGDESSVQNDKVTLQIYSNSRIICYAKVTKEDEVTTLFEHEIEALGYLKEKGIGDIPGVIGAGHTDKVNVFVQTTVKPLNAKFKAEFDSKQLEYIKNIVNATKVECLYEESEFYKQIQYLKAEIKANYPDHQRMIINHSISIIEAQLKGKKGEYAFCHGDFTPWNVYYTGKTMNVFDFEYCMYVMPCYIDVFHYMTQMSLLGMKNNGDETIGVYEKHRKLLEKYIDNTDFTYLCYLLSIISFYNKRTIRSFEIDDMQYRDWIEIISYLNSRLD